MCRQYFVPWYFVFGSCTCAELDVHASSCLLKSSFYPRKTDWACMLFFNNSLLHIHTDTPGSCSDHSEQLPDGLWIGYWTILLEQLRVKCLAHRQLDTSYCDRILFLFNFLALSLPSGPNSNWQPSTGPLLYHLGYCCPRQYPKTHSCINTVRALGTSSSTNCNTNSQYQLLHSTPVFHLFSWVSLSDLVDGDGEGWLDVHLHVFLPVVAEKVCSFQNGVHFCPALRVTS